MSSIYLTRVFSQDMTERDIYWLSKRAKLEYDEITGADILKDVIAGYKQIWRISGECEGLIISSVLKTTWNLEFIVGNKLLQHAEAIHQKLLHRAKLGNCKVIEGQTNSKGLLKFFDKLGFKQSAICVRKNCG